VAQKEVDKVRKRILKFVMARGLAHDKGSEVEGIMAVCFPHQALEIHNRLRRLPIYKV
jgi:hypothetical protein